MWNDEFYKWAKYVFLYNLILEFTANRVECCAASNDTFCLSFVWVLWHP